MGDIRMELTPWPVGTSVSAYQRKSELMLDDQPPPQIPIATTAAVGDDYSLAFTGLDAGSYWAIGPIDTRMQYVAFLIP